MTRREVIIAWMQSQLNRPYIWGGDDFRGWDCSGLVQEYLKTLGCAPPTDMTAFTLMNFLIMRYAAEVTPSQMEFGDVLFFGKSPDITHTSIYVGGGLHFEAGGGTSKTVDEASAARDNAFVRFRPLRPGLDTALRLFPTYW